MKYLHYKFLAWSAIFFSCAQAYQPVEVGFGHISLSELSLARPGAFEQALSGKNSLVRLIRSADEFKHCVLESKQPVVIRIGAGGKAVSDMFKKTYQHAARDLKGKVQFAAINIMQNKWFMQLIASKLNLKTLQLPSMVFFQNGSLLLPLQSGATSKSHLVASVNKMFFSH